MAMVMATSVSSTCRHDPPPRRLLFAGDSPPDHTSTTKDILFTGSPTSTHFTLSLPTPSTHSHHHSSNSQQRFDCSHDVGDGSEAACLPEKDHLECCSTYWQEVLESVSVDIGEANVHHHVLELEEHNLYDNTWKLQLEPWELEGSNIDDVLLTRTELLGFAEQKNEQQHILSSRLVDQADLHGREADTRLAMVSIKSPVSLNPEDEVSVRKRKIQASELEKEKHILNERQRRKSMNDLFDTMRCLLPASATKKDKAALVSRFTEHVKAEQQKVEGLKRKVEELKQKRADQLSAAEKSPPQEQLDVLEKEDDVNNKIQNPSITDQLPHFHSHLMPCVKINRTGEDAYVVVICINDPKLSLSIIKAMNDHSHQLVDVHISSTEAMMVHNLHSKVKDGSSFHTDNDLQTKLQKLIGI